MSHNIKVEMREHQDHEWEPEGTAIVSKLDHYHINAVLQSYAVILWKGTGNLNLKPCIAIMLSKGVVTIASDTTTRQYRFTVEKKNVK